MLLWLPVQAQLCVQLRQARALGPKFRFLREGKGLGSLFCLKNTDEPSTPDPAKENLTEFKILMGDTFDERSL